MERLAFNYFGGQGSTPPRVETPGTRAASVSAVETDRLAYRAVLAFMLVLLVRPQDQLPFLEPLRLAEVCGAVAAGSLVVGRLARGVPLARVTPELAGVIGLAMVMIGTVPFSFWPGGSMGLVTNLLLKMLVITAIVVNTVTTRARFEKLTAVLVLGTGYVGARAVVDYARGVNLVDEGRVKGAVGGLFGNPNDMALTMVSFLPLAIALALAPGRRYLKWLGLAAIPALTGAVIFSKSRGGAVGLIAMLIVALCYLHRLRPGVAAAILAAGLAAVPMLPASFWDRMSSIVDSDQDATGSREARKTLLREGFQTFLANPFIGIGAGQFPNYNPSRREEPWRQTHNAVLQVAAELGLLGLIVFLFMIGSGFGAGSSVLRSVQDARRRRRGPPAGRGAQRPSSAGAAPDAETQDWLEITAAMVIAAFAGWFVASMFASVAYYWTLYLLLAVASAIRLIGAEAAGGAAGRVPSPAPRGASC